MYYKEWLCVRRYLIVLTIGLLALLGIVALVGAVTALGSAGGHTHATQPQGMTGVIDFFGTTALVIGGLMATVLGSALSRENDGHLEAAWTKPYSRTAYATAVMLVDAAGIAIAILIGLVVHALVHAALRTPISLAGASTMAGDLARFLLFPFAWYAVIVALSARVRGGGLVQGLIWPIGLILLGLHEIPLGPVWQGLTGLLNLVNPLTYIQYHETGYSLLTTGGGSMASAFTADVALALLVVGGWALATMQWRRMEA